MAIGTTAAIIGAAVLGVGATAVQVNQQQKLADEQAKRLDDQEEAAREAGKLDTPDADTGASVALGREERPTRRRRTQGAGRGGGSTRQGSIGRTLGGVSASSGVGL